MKKLPTFFFFSYLLFPCVLMITAEAQEMVPLKFNADINASGGTIVDDTLYSDNGEVAGISNVTEPSMEIYLPEPKIATGTGVIVLPGGALRFLSWENEGTRVVKWLNSKGIADAWEAIRLVRKHSAEWNVRPEHIGFLGFLAGGCVALSAVITNEGEASMPDFIATAYGPSLIDVVVPENAPPLFLAVNAEHMNVAAGCLALFTFWKKAGANAEIHIYDVGQGPFGMRQTGHPSDAWPGSYHNWLYAYGF